MNGLWLSFMRVLLVLQFQNVLYTSTHHHRQPNEMIICVVSVMVLIQAQEMEFHILWHRNLCCVSAGDNKRNERVLRCILTQFLWGKEVQIMGFE